MVFSEVAAAVSASSIGEEKKALYLLNIAKTFLLTGNTNGCLLPSTKCPE